MIVGDEFHSLRRHRPDPGLVQSWDRMVDKMFGSPDDQRDQPLSRVSPFYTQTYWNEAERHLRPSRRSRQARRDRRRRTWSDGIRDRRATMIAPGDDHAVNRRPDAPTEPSTSTPRVMRSTPPKNSSTTCPAEGRTMDALRLAFPFGEAWREVATRWFGLGPRRTAARPAVGWQAHTRRRSVASSSSCKALGARSSASS